jgi:hypothetical protein
VGVHCTGLYRFVIARTFIDQLFSYLGGRLLHSGKYNTCVLSNHLCIGLHGLPLAHTGPHSGPDHDMEKYRQFRHKYPLRRNEWGFGDLAYGGAQRYLTGRKNEGDIWTTFDEYWNSLISFYRARIEKVISRIKAHSWCQQVFRGNFELFVALQEISVVLASLEIRREFEAGTPMFEVIGPWRHSF